MGGEEQMGASSQMEQARWKSHPLQQGYFLPQAQLVLVLFWESPLLSFLAKTWPLPSVLLILLFPPFSLVPPWPLTFPLVPTFSLVMTLPFPLLQPLVSWQAPHLQATPPPRAACEPERPPLRHPRFECMWSFEGNLTTVSGYSVD